MAIDVCSEISISPRISFSYDLNQKTEHPVINNSVLCSDFDFCCSFVQTQEELCCADELFSNGKILPVQIKKPNPVSSSSPRSTDTHHHTEKKQLKEFLLMSIEDEDEDEDEDEEERACKSFWQFKRSNSLNCDTSVLFGSRNGIEWNRSKSRSRGLIRSLQFLTRSNSTPNPSKQPKKLLQKQHSVPNSKTPRAPAPFYPYNYYSGHHHHKNSPAPALRKCGSYGNTHTHGVTISPVLNISTVNLFGLPSLFCNTKVKHNK